MANYLVEARQYNAWQQPIIDKDLTAPPASPSKGDRYLIISPSFSWDLLNEDCADISDWTDADAVNGVSEVDPAGQFRMDGNTNAPSNLARRYRSLTLPVKSTVEIKLYHDKIGLDTFNQQFQFKVGRTGFRFFASFNNNGQLRIEGNFVCSDVKEGTSAEWQTWRFEIDSTTPASATCDVYLTDSTHTDEKVGSNIDCSSVADQTDIVLTQWGFDDIGGIAEDCVTHIDYVKVGTGLTGDWPANTDKIAQYNGLAWDFATPLEGWMAYVKDEDKIYRFDGSNWIAYKTAVIGLTLDGGGQVIETGYKGYIRVPWACTITKATLTGDKPSGSAVVDVWKCSYADYDGGVTHPVDADSITASAPPTISSAAKSEDSTLSGWTVSISAGEYLAFNVDSCSTFERLVLQLEVTKT